MFALGAALGSLATIAWLSVGGKIQLLERWSSDYDDLAHYREVRDFVRERYVGDSDPDTLVRVALTSMVESLDEYSRYYHTNNEIEGFKRETRGSFAGIGIADSMWSPGHPGNEATAAKTLAIEHQVIACSLEVLKEVTKFKCDSRVAPPPCKALPMKGNGPVEIRVRTDRIHEGVIDHPVDECVRECLFQA